MAGTPLELAGAISRTNPGNVDKYYDNDGNGWATKAAAVAGVPIALRIRKKVLIDANATDGLTNATEYWWPGPGTADADLVPYNFDDRYELQVNRPAYSIDSFSPTSGATGQTITIYGNGFSADNAVYFTAPGMLNGVKQEIVGVTYFEFVSSRIVKVQVPPGAISGRIVYDFSPALAPLAEQNTPENYDQEFLLLDSDADFQVTNDNKAVFQVGVVSGAVVLDYNNSINQSINLGGNVTSLDLVNHVSGAEGEVIVTQNNTTAYNVTLAAGNMLVGGGLEGVLINPTLNSITLLSYLRGATTTYWRSSYPTTASSGTGSGTGTGTTLAGLTEATGAYAPIVPDDTILTAFGKQKRQPFHWGHYTVIEDLQTAEILPKAGDTADVGDPVVRYQRAGTGAWIPFGEGKPAIKDFNTEDVYASFGNGNGQIALTTLDAYYSLNRTGKSGYWGYFSDQTVDAGSGVPADAIGNASVNILESTLSVNSAPGEVDNRSARLSVLANGATQIMRLRLNRTVTQDGVEQIYENAFWDFKPDGIYRNGTLYSTGGGGTGGDTSTLLPKRLNRFTITASASLTLDHLGGWILINSASAVTITVPSGLLGGYQVLWKQVGAGQVTFVAGTGMTLENHSSLFKSKGPKAWGTIALDSDTVASIGGDLVA